GEHEENNARRRDRRDHSTPGFPEQIMIPNYQSLFPFSLVISFCKTTAMRSIVLFLFTIILFSQTGFTQVLKEASPESAGMSPERLKRIDNLIREYVDKKWIAGGSAIVARDGKIIYYK